MQGVRGRRPAPASTLVPAHGPRLVRPAVSRRGGGAIAGGVAAGSGACGGAACGGAACGMESSGGAAVMAWEGSGRGDYVQETTPRPRSVAVGGRRTLEVTRLPACETVVTPRMPGAQDEWHPACQKWTSRKPSVPVPGKLRKPAWAGEKWA